MSEFSLIYQYFKQATPQHHDTILSIGDDCAVSHIPPHQQLVSCIDTLVAGRHFPLNTSAYAIGFKSVAVNLSDLASMGAKPYAILLALSLPSEDHTWLKDFAQGLSDICQAFGIELIGGDTTKSDILTISVTALGTIPQGQAILRNGAKVGDIICVSGEIGSASYALQQILQRNDSDLKNNLDLPQPQVALGQKLRYYAHSMIDISDGLAQDLAHILNASHVGAKLFLEQIPAHQILQQLPKHERWQHQLNGGDDYQLLWTMNAHKLHELQSLFPDKIFPIGEIVTGQGLQLFEHGQQIDFTIQGWQHF